MSRRKPRKRLRGNVVLRCDRRAMRLTTVTKLDHTSKYQMMEGVTALSKGETRPRALEDELRDHMVRYQAGTAAGAEELVQRLSSSLFGYFINQHVPYSDAEDLLQECWMRIHRSRHTYNASEPLLPWVFAIARHTWLDGDRRRNRLAAREVLVAEPPEPAGCITAETSQGPDVLQLLDQLPPNQREVVLLLKVSGMSLEEVAHVTSSSVGAIKQKAHRAYARLRDLLAGEG
jgi:RNA polymerase sigma-70 factor (ECF subfamily)